MPLPPVCACLPAQPVIERKGRGQPPGPCQGKSWVINSPRTSLPGRGGEPCNTSFAAHSAKSPLLRDPGSERTEAGPIPPAPPSPGRGSASGPLTTSPSCLHFSESPLSECVFGTLKVNLAEESSRLHSGVLRGGGPRRPLCNSHPLFPGRIAGPSYLQTPRSSTHR